MTQPTDIMVFDGKYAFLSNFYPCSPLYMGQVWKSSEHAYQAAKALSATDFTAIADAGSPGQAKRMGKKLAEAHKVRPDWNDVRVGIMHDILVAKFAIPDLEERLLSTGKLKLVEGNMHHDVFWGVDIRTGKGQNMLGKLLMQIREQKQSFE